MSATPLIPDILWQQVCPAAPAAIYASISRLEQRGTELETRLGQNSSDSSKPSSSDPLHVKRCPPRPSLGKPRGGWRGHQRHFLELVSLERLMAAIDCKPAFCRGCGQGLKGDDLEPIRHQIAELPEARPDVVEYRFHQLICPRCAAATHGELPAGVSQGAFGPRLQTTGA